MKILIVEDEPSLREVMQRTLEAERYVVECAGDYPTAVCKTEDYSYDCILLDIMLPGGSGLEVLRRLRERGRSSNVIVISARDSLEDKVTGLELGADDYLAKPFHLAELSARVRSVIRRGQRSGGTALQMGNVSLEPDAFRVRIGGEEVELLRKEFDMLNYFMTRRGHIVSKETLAEAVWGDHIDQVDNFDFLYAQVKNLRRKLREAGATIELRAVYGFGYKLTEQS